MVTPAPLITSSAAHLYRLNPAHPAHSTAPTPTPSPTVPNPSTTLVCHRSRLKAAAYPISARNVTISYSPFHPRTGCPGNGSVSDR